MSAAAVSFPPVFVSTRPVETSVASEQEELQATEELRAIVRRVASSVWYHVQPDTVPDVPGADNVARALAAALTHAAGGIAWHVESATFLAQDCARFAAILVSASVVNPGARGLTWSQDRRHERYDRSVFEDATDLLGASAELLAWCARWSTRCPDSGEMLMARRVSL